MTVLTATVAGFGAVLLWATLALFTVGAAGIPPFQLTAMSFAVGGMIGVVWMAVTGRRAGRLGWRVWLLGVGGLFGYHVFYFTALSNAPPAEAGLIAYLWPLLIVLFSGLLPGERLRPRHLIGAGIAFVGAALILGQAGLSFSSDHSVGYGAAVLCALLWSSYSVLSRRVGRVPTEAVALFCLVTAGLSGVAHLGLETTVRPASALVWLSVLALGAGPVGVAFYLWDVGVKRGDIQLLGVGAYAAPLLSTLLLVVTGAAPFTATLGIAALLISAGAAIAAGLLSGRRSGA